MMNQSDEDLVAHFQMQTPNAKASVPSGFHAQRLPSYDGSKVARDTEEKCSKLLADAESRILDERNKFHQKDLAMKEDLLKEKSRTSEATQQKVKDVLALYRQQVDKSPALTTAHHQSVVSHMQTESKSVQDDLTQKVRRLETQLAERERELEAADRRHQEEKKELLSLRTSQLKLESSRKGEEGEMVNRAMATIAEYEAAVRKSEAENATRLAEYMDTFTKDWLSRARDFEEHKARFEGETLEKAFQIMRDQETSLAEKEERMRLRMVDVLTQHGEARLDQEQRLLEQFEKFKIDYKGLQDRDFDARCSMYDEALQKREVILFDKLTVERQKMVEMEQRAADAAEMQRVQSLNEAMQQLSHMREQILADNHRKQEELQLQLLKQRDMLHQELIDAERLKTEQMAAMQQKVIDAMNEAHRIVADVKRQMSQNESETHEKYIGLMNQRNKDMEAEALGHKEDLERQYFSKLNELSTAHSLEIKRLTDEFLEKQQHDSSDAFKREQELRQSYDQKMLKFEEETQRRYRRQLQEAAENEAALKEQLQMLRREISDVNAQAQQQQQMSKTHEMQLEARLAKAQRDIDTAKLEAEEELRAKYERWLEEATAGAHQIAVDKMEFERLKRDAEAAEKRSVELIRREREAMQGQRDQMKESCERRVAEERSRIERLEADLLERVADMRVELEAEMKRKEAANQRLFDTERRSLYEEANERAAEERRERQAYEERVKEMEEARWRAVNKDVQQSCEERIKAHEIRITEREAELDAREAAMRQEKLAVQQKAIADKQRLDSDEWELRSRLEATIRKEAEARLSAERERLQGELDAIRKHAVDQQRAMEEARLQLQRQMEDERGQAESDMQRRYDAMMEKTAEEQREAMRAREAAMHDKEIALRDKHQKALAGISDTHRKEVDAMEARLDSIRSDIETEKADYQVECKEAFRRREEAIRLEAAARVKAEQEALRQKELQMQYDNDRLRLEIEATARESMQKLFDARSKHWEDADEERKRLEAEFFNKIRERIEASDADMQAKQQRFQDAMRTFTDKALAEQQRQLTSSQAADMERLQEECTRLRAQLAKQKQADAAEETQRVEERLAEHRRVLDREREQERRLAEEAHDKQLTDMQRRSESRLQDMTASYEAQLSKLRDTLSLEKQQAQQALLEKDEDASRKLEDTSKQLHSKMDGLLTDLKQMYEKKWRQMQEQDLEKAAALDKQKMEYDAKVKASYEELLKEAERQYHQSLEEREKQRAVDDREKDRAMQQLRQELDLLRVHEVDEVERRVRERATELTKQLEDEKREYLGVVDTERERREAAERNVTTLQQELDKITYSMNQWKLELHRSLVSKYENLFNEVQSRARKDREAFARKLLEEEEKRLARELVRKDTELARSRTETERAASRECEEREHRAQAAELHLRIKRLFEAFGSKREKLLKLWDLIDTDPSERMQLLTGIFGKLGMLASIGSTTASPDISPRRSEVDLSNHMLQVVNMVYEELSNEIARLEAQLPLMDTITRREFVKHRLGEVFQAPASATRDTQIIELQRELQILDEQLLADLPRYEQTHNAKLFYKNQRYLLVMEKDLQQTQKTPALTYMG